MNDQPLSATFPYTLPYTGRFTIIIIAASPRLPTNSLQTQSVESTQWGRTIHTAGADYSRQYGCAAREYTNMVDLS